MPRDGQGQYAPPLSNWNPAVDGNEADPAGWNQYRDDVSAAISQSVSADGQTLMTGPLNMGGQRIQSLAAPIGNGHALRRDQLIKGTNIASASTIEIPNEGSLFEITGTTTIEHITGAFDGRLITLLFQDELIIKNGLDIVLPLGADIKTNPGLMLQIQRVGNNKWSVIGYPEATLTAPGIQRAARRYVTEIPETDQGPIDMVGVGPMDWDIDDEIYKALITTADDLQWLGTPVGGYITPFEAPPKDDPRFRYILCTAGHATSGGYNAGVISGETVQGSAPLIRASATVSLSGSPMVGTVVRLINTDRRFIAPGAGTVLEDDMFQGHTFEVRWSGAGSGTTSLIKTGSTLNWDAALVRGPVEYSGYGAPRFGDRTQPSALRVPHYQRIM